MGEGGCSHGGTVRDGRAFPHPPSPIPHPSSRNLQQFSREISQYLRAGGGKVDVVLNADSAPAWFVYPWLDRYHRTFAKKRLDGFCQARCLVNFESKPVTQAVAERVAVAALLDEASSETVRILTFHPGPHRPGRDSVCLAHDVVDLALVAGRLPHHDRACDVGAVPFVLCAEIGSKRSPR